MYRNFGDRNLCESFWPLFCFRCEGWRRVGGQFVGRRVHEHMVRQWLSLHRRSGNCAEVLIWPRHLDGPGAVDGLHHINRPRHAVAGVGFVTGDDEKSKVDEPGEDDMLDVISLPPLLINKTHVVTTPNTIMARPLP